MSKPIQIKLTDQGLYEVWVKGMPIVPGTDKQVKLYDNSMPDATPARMTYKDAEHIAHMVGRYKLKLGDLVWTYVDGYKEEEE